MQKLNLLLLVSYINIGLLKYKVKPPNTEIIIPPINGIYGIFFSIK